MKNKLLVSVFAMVAAFAFTSCESKSDSTVHEVCGDLIKESIHKSPRSLLELDENNASLAISEYEFLGGVNDSRMVYRTIAFGDGSQSLKKVDTLVYEYGEWSADFTEFSLFITPLEGMPYTLIYKGNAFLTPDGRSIGGGTSESTARVEKWEKVIATFPNTAWEATYKGDFEIDTVWVDSIKKTFIPGKGTIYDTIKVWKGDLDTLNADTTCLFHYEFLRDASTLANTGRLYMKGIRSTYNRETKQAEVVKENESEVAFNWYFSDVTSDSRFALSLKKNNEAELEKVVISKYALDSVGVAKSCLCGGLNYTSVDLP